MRSKFAAQPGSTSEGLQQAYESFRREMHTTRRVVVVPLSDLENGKFKAVGSLVRALPVAVLRPMIGITEGLSKTVLGLRNELQPNMKQDADAKYKAPT